ncbi:MAG: HpcH/HpaI aldolase family protein, partial [Acetobacteraceae bacterium]
MPEIPRLNGAIRALEANQPAFAPFTSAEIGNALTFGASACDGVVFEMEHNPYDIRALRDCLQYMLNRRQIATSGSIAPAVTPFVRIPPNGGENSQWIAKQVLDIGVYGVVWPHVSTIEDARNAVAACRYPRMKNASLYEPAGIRGDGPTAAARYWGLSQQDYYKKADVWPLNKEGEVFCILQIEDTRGVENLDAMLKDVPGIGAI